MPRTLYIFDPSPPARGAWMCCKALGVDVQIKHVDTFAGDQFSDWFIQMNPEHCVPTLDDDGFILWECRAIARYLVNKYAPDSNLYPSDPEHRALVDRALDHDLGKHFVTIVLQYAFPQLVMRVPAPDAKDVCNLLTAMDTRGPISEGKYITGDQMTIADIITVATLTFLEFVDFDYSPYPNLSAWIARMKAQPFYAECNAGFEQYKQYAKTEAFIEKTAELRKQLSG